MGGTKWSNEWIINERVMKFISTNARWPFPPLIIECINTRPNKIAVTWAQKKRRKKKGEHTYCFLFISESLAHANLCIEPSGCFVGIEKRPRPLSISRPKYFPNYLPTRVLRGQLYSVYSNCRLKRVESKRISSWISHASRESAPPLYRKNPFVSDIP